VPRLLSVPGTSIVGSKGGRRGKGLKGASKKFPRYPVYYQAKAIFPSDPKLNLMNGFQVGERQGLYNRTIWHMLSKPYFNRNSRQKSRKASGGTLGGIGS
jgi:hypothetical protein